MAMYNELVMEHFLHPRNVGVLDETDGVSVGSYGSPICGDTTDIFIKVENDVIVDAKFKTFGCCAAIASSSMATEMLKGMTIDEALTITTAQIVERLGGLPDPKVHCSVLADHAIKTAIYHYAQREGKHYAGLEGFDPNKSNDPLEK